MVNRSRLAYFICGSIKKEKVLKMSLKLLLLKLNDTELALCSAYLFTYHWGRGVCAL